ncbi:hypothetical protein [Bathymodiolus platifrons methanotrophic gill symbiont]|uniref:hypothetical protein n=1 Tax=Bathymodiolus platifrons methanotrophic gill symbiont TaxID=113268 RepID=UPI00142E5680|nr:hypothetical protein [Bathymodiolus platifrons methanotrophic gill symbiont]
MQPKSARRGLCESFRKSLGIENKTMAVERHRKPNNADYTLLTGINQPPTALLT